MTLLKDQKFSTDLSPIFKWIRRSENYFNSLSKTLSLCYSEFRLILTTATKILKDSNDGFVLDRPTVRDYNIVRLPEWSIKITPSNYIHKLFERKCHVEFFSELYNSLIYTQYLVLFTWVFIFFATFYNQIKMNAIFSLNIRYNVRKPLIFFVLSPLSSYFAASQTDKQAHLRQLH